MILNRNLSLAAFVMFFVVGGYLHADVPQPGKKVERYLSILEKRPESGYLFDRFYNAWLQEGTVSQLEVFLKDRSAKSGTNGKVLLALLYEKEGQDARALALYSEALRQKGDSAELLYRKACLEAATLNFRGAISDFTRALKCNPKDQLAVKIYKNLGKVYLRNGEQNKAIGIWKKMQSQAPNDLELQEDLMEMFISEGLHEQAMKTCQKIIASTSNNYKKLMLELRMGDIHQRAGNRKQALKSYLGTLERIGGGSWLEKEVLSQIEHLYRLEDDITGLRKCYQEMVKSHPKRIGLLKRHAQLLQECGQSDQAIKAFVEVMRLAPGDRSIREQYIQMLVKANLNDKALVAANELVKQYPADQQLLMKLASIQHKAGKQKDAYKTILQYVDKSDKSQYTYLRAARMLETFKQASEADAIYKKMTVAFPDSSDAKEAYAAYLYRQKKADAACALLLDACKKDNLSVLLRIARTLNSHKQSKEAYTLLTSQQDKYAKDYQFLTVIAEVASGLDKHEEVLAYSRKRLDVAVGLTQLESSVGRAVLSAQKLKQTVQLLDELKATKNLSAGQTCLLSELLELQGDTEKNDTFLTKRLDANPRESLLRWQQFRVARRRQNWSAALIALEGMLQSETLQRSKLMPQLVQAAIQANANKKALRWIAEWKRLSPTATTPYRIESQVHMRAGNYDAAIRALLAGTVKFPDDKGLLGSLSDAYTQKGQYRQAQRMQWKLLEKSTDITERLSVVDRLANIAEIQGKTEALLRHFETRCQTNRKSVFAPLALARIHRSQGNYEERRKYLWEASGRRSDDVGLLYEIARIEEEDGQAENAIATLEKAMSVDKTDKSRQRLINLLYRQGYEERGAKLLREMIVQGNKDPQSIESLAGTLFSSGQYEQAIDILKDAFARYPDNYRLGYLLAVSHEEAEQINEGVEVFLKLLEIQKELVGAKSQGQKNPMTAYIHHYAGFFPPETMDIMVLQNVRYQAYSYKNRQHMPGYSQGQGLPLPGSIQQLNQFVLAHLGQLSAEMTEQEAEALADNVRMKGISKAKIKLLAVHNDFERVLPILDKYFEKNPKDIGIAALIAIRTFNSRQEFNSKRFHEVCKLLEEQYPQLVATVTLASANMPEVDKEQIARAIEHVRKADKPHPFLIHGLVQGMRGKAEGEEEKRRQAELCSLLVDTHRKLDNNSPIKQQMVAIVAVVLQQRGREKEFVDFVESEAQSSNAQNAMMAFYSSRATQRRLLDELTFPPVQVPGLSPTILSILQGDNRFMFAFGGGESRQDIDCGVLAKEAQRVKRPAVRVLLLWKSGNDELVGKEVDALLKSSKPLLSELFLAASWKASQQKHAETVAILNKARILPMKQQDRGLIDSAILAHCLADLQDKKLAKLAKDTALRLRRSRLDPNQRNELVQAFEQLGMEKEADKLAGVSTGTPGVGPAVMPHHVRVSSRQNVEVLIKKGKRKLAVKRLVREYRSYLSQAMRPNNRHGGMSYQLMECMRKIRSYCLNKEFLAALKPDKEAASAKNLIEYGFACDRLNQDEQAIDSYRQALKKKPGDVFASVQLAILLSKTDRDKARELIQSVSKRRAKFPYQLLCQEIEHHDIPFERVLSVSELLADVLEVGVGKFQPEQGNRVFYKLESSHYNNGEHIEGLYASFEKKDVTDLLPGFSATTQPATKPKKKDGNKYAERRLAVYKRLCEVALEYPAVANDAFQRKTVLGASREKLILDALKALQTRAKDSRFTSHGSYNSGNEIGEFSITPEMYLAMQATLGKQGERVRAAISGLKGHKAKSIQKQMDDYYLLFDVEEKKFIETAQEALKRYPQGPWGTQGFGLYDIVGIWMLRSLKVSLTDMVVADAKGFDRTTGSPAQYRHHDRSAQTRWAQAANKMLGKKATVDYLDKLGRLYVKPVAKGKAATSQPTSKPRSRRRSPWTGSRETPVQAYAEFLGALDERGLLWSVLTYASSVPEIWKEYRGRLNRNSGWRLCEDSAIYSLDDSPFLADWNNFMMLMTGEGKGSLLQTFIRLCNDCSIRKGKVVAFLKKRKNSTFGSGLLSVLLTKGTPEQVFVYLADHWQVMKSGDPQRLNEFLYGLQGILATDDPMINDRIAEKRFVDSLLAKKSEKQAQAIREVIARYCKSTRPLKKVDVAAFKKRPIVNGVYDYCNWAGKEIVIAAASDTQAAKQMWQEATRKIRRASRGTGRRYEDDISELFDDIAENARSSEQIRFVTVFCQTEKTLPQNAVRQVLWKINEWCDNSRRSMEDSLRKKIKDRRTRRLEVAKRQTVFLAKTFKDAYVPNGREISSDIIRPLDKKERKAFCDWLREERGKYKDPVPLLSEISLWAERMSTGAKKEVDRKLAAFYFEMARNEKVTCAFRLFNLLQILTGNNRFRDNGPLFDDSPLVLAVAELMIKADSGYIVNDWQHIMDFIERFNKLPVDEKWTEVATKLSKYMFKVRRTTRGYGGGINRLWLRVAETHLRLGNKDGGMAIVNDRHHKMELSSETYSRLIRYDVEGWLIQKLPQCWRVLGPVRSHELISPTPDIQQRVIRIVDAMPSEEMKYLAEVFYAGVVADGPKDPRRGHPNKLSPKQKLLIDRYAKVEFQSQDVRMKCLELLPFTESLKDEYTKVYDAIDPRTAVLSSGNGNRTRKDRYSLYLTNLVWAGELDKFTKKIAPLQEADDSNENYAIRNFLDNLKQKLGDGFFNGAYSNACSPKKLMTFNKELIARTKRLSWSDIPLVNATYLLHYVTGQGDKAEAWLTETEGRVKNHGFHPSGRLNPQALMNFFTAVVKISSLETSAKAFLEVSESKVMKNHSRGKKTSGQFMIQYYGGYLNRNPKDERTLLLRRVLTQYAANQEELLKSEPKSKTILHELLLCYRVLRNPEKQEETYSRYCKAVPESGSYLGYIHFLQRKGKHAQAAVVCDEAMKVLGKDARIVHTALNVYDRVKQYDKAFDAAKTLTGLKPKQGSSWYRYASLCARKNKFDEACEAYNNAIAVATKPEHRTQYQVGLMRYYVKLKKEQEAVALAKTIVREGVGENHKKKARAILRKYQPTSQPVTMDEGKRTGEPVVR